jgi:16S rRNA (cytidine1402-2'-O)-methyltransferase
MGNLYVVATPIGNLSDMTERAVETLKKADYILCEDTRNSIKLLNHFNIKNRLVAYHKFNEQEKTESIIKDLKEGKNIALISDAGTPCINDPGEVIVRNARENKIPVLGIGGISAMVTALSISGLDTTSFTYYGFFPREKKEQDQVIEEITNSKVKTFIFYESPKRIIKTVELLAKKIPNQKISISKELTKLHEKNFYGDINKVLEELKKDDKTTSGEYTFIIEKKDIVKKEEQNVSIEAKLIDLIIKNNITVKGAVDKLNKESKDLSKKEIYKASLNLKDILK